jgi:hypothetical protein
MSRWQAHRIVAQVALGTTLAFNFSQIHAGPVHRCLAADGSVEFVQFGCPTGTTISSSQPDVGVLSVIKAPPLSETARQALNSLESRLLKQRRQRQGDRRRRMEADNRARQDALAQCEKARTALAGLKATRRKGYSAEQGRRYEDQEQRWRDVKKTAC